MNITYYMQRNYGEDQRYPVSDDAWLVTVLMNTKTITDHAVATLERHGATITEVLKPR
jgi:hypothetical protein